MKNTRFLAILIVVLAIGIGAFNYYSEFKPNSGVGKFPFKLGLDLNGGSHLVYQADVSKVDSAEVSDSMQTLRDVIENRINVFGVSEPVVQVEEAKLLSGEKVEKLIVELPGVTDVDKAIALIGQTPDLDFRVVNSALAGKLTATSSQADIDKAFVETGLTGRFLEKAQLEFDQNTSEPLVTLVFNSEGKDLFAKITKANIGNVIAIFLDGRPISSPVVRQEISDGRAQISGGNMTPTEARTLVRNLNYGALPVPISLIGTQTIGASLGADALNKSVKSGLWGLGIIALFLILWYRLPGLVATVSLSIYVLVMLALFKLIPVTLTSAGLAGFILSIGMAVDANILIFERMREEFKKGLSLSDGIREGFSRAWFSIRDGNLSSIITAVILFWFSSTSIIRGFALIFGIGVLVSMLTAITISRTFLIAVAPKKEPGKLIKFLFSNGFTK
jgi:preprotein translocase subunit SecD